MKVFKHPANEGNANFKMLRYYFQLLPLTLKLFFNVYLLISLLFHKEGSGRGRRRES